MMEGLTRTCGRAVKIPGTNDVVEMGDATWLTVCVINLHLC
jgi:hypothetical protein